MIEQSGVKIGSIHRWNNKLGVHIRILLYIYISINPEK